MNGPPNGQGTHGKNTARGRDAIEWGMTAGAILLIVVLQVMAYFGKNELLSLAANLSTALFTFFVSYVITRYFAEKAARAELFDLGQASGEQVALLSLQLQQLAEEVDDFTPEDDRSQLYLTSISSQLQKLGSQAELSFHNIQRMAGLDFSMVALRDEVQTAIKHGIREEKVPCPHCGIENRVPVSTSPGASKPTKCVACRKPFTAHRLSDESIKLMFPDIHEVRCPNPKCGNQIFVKKKDTDWGTLIRNCFECYARIKYNVDTTAIEEWSTEAPLEASGLSADRVGCPYCGHESLLRGGRNSRGEKLMSCPSCTRLMRLTESTASRPV
jgi:transposase-like protein